MACISLVTPLAMATTELARVIHYEDADVAIRWHCGTQSPKHELGRGHRQCGQPEAANAVGTVGGSSLTVPLVVT